MQDIQNAVNAALIKMIEEGQIEKLIQDKVGKLLDDVISDAMRSYSDFGKQVSESIKKGLLFDADRINLGEYNQKIVLFVKARMDAMLDTQAKKQIDEMLDQIFVPPPETMKLSELVKEYVDHARGHSDEHEHETPTVIHERSKYSLDCIYLDVESDKDKYQCEVRFLVTKDTGLVSDIHFGGGKKIETSLFYGPRYGFEKRLFQLWSHRTKIEIDEVCAEDFDPSY